MFKLSKVLTVAVLATLGSTVALAQQQPPAGDNPGGGDRAGQRRPGGGGDRGGMRPGGGLGGFLGGQQMNQAARIGEVVTDLTEEQKTKLKSLGDEFREAMEDFGAEVQEKMRDLRGGGGGQDWEQVREEFQKLNEERENMVRKFDQEMLAVLTPEQRATWETYRLNQMLNDRLRGARLTDEQKAKVAELAKTTGKSLAEAKDAKERNATIGKLLKQIVAEVLTDEQMVRILEPQPFQMMGRPGGPGGAPGDRGLGGARPGGAGGDTPAPTGRRRPGAPGGGGAGGDAPRPNN